MTAIEMLGRIRRWKICASTDMNTRNATELTTCNQKHDETAILDGSGTWRTCVRICNIITEASLGYFVQLATMSVRKTDNIFKACSVPCNSLNEAFEVS